MKNNVALMMNAKRLAYPTISPTVRSILDHWFLVNGNGYEWDENGELFSDEIHDPIDRFGQALKMSVEGRTAKWLVYEEAVACLDRDYDRIERERLHDERMKELFEAVGQVYVPISDPPEKYTLLDQDNQHFTWYPMSQYSMALTIPENAPRVWKNAVLGTMRLVIKDTEAGRFIHRGRHWKPDHNIEWASKAIRRINEFK